MSLVDLFKTNNSKTSYFLLFPFILLFYILFKIYLLNLFLYSFERSHSNNDISNVYTIHPQVRRRPSSVGFAAHVSAVPIRGRDICSPIGLVLTTISARNAVKVIAFSLFSLFTRKDVTRQCVDVVEEGCMSDFVYLFLKLILLDG